MEEQSLRSLRRNLKRSLVALVITMGLLAVSTSYLIVSQIHMKRTKAELYLLRTLVLQCSPQQPPLVLEMPSLNRPPNKDFSPDGSTFTPNDLDDMTHSLRTPICLIPPFYAFLYKGKLISCKVYDVWNSRRENGNSQPTQKLGMMIGTSCIPVVGR